MCLMKAQDLSGTGDVESIGREDTVAVALDVKVVTARVPARAFTYTNSIDGCHTQPAFYTCGSTRIAPRLVMSPDRAVPSDH